MKRILTVVAALAALVLVGAVAWAHAAPGARGLFMKHMVSAKIDDALAAAKASPAQLSAIHGQRDRVFAALDEARAKHEAERPLVEALALFEQPTLDDKVIAAKRAEHVAEARGIADVVVDALHQAHDDLTAPQRQAVVAYVKGLQAEHEARGKGWQEGMKAHVDAKIAEALTAIGATPAQRALVEKLHAQIHAAMMAAHASQKGAHEEALALFAGEWNDAAVKALRAGQEQAHLRVADAFIDGLHQLHAALSPEQRHQLVDFVKAQHGGDLRRPH